MHAYDFFTVINTIGDMLPKKQKEEMVAFFENDLKTNIWMRSLSVKDPNAMFSVRPDHQWNGAYPAWPSQSLMALIRAGKKELALSWIDGLSKSANQGPFGQAHFTETIMKTDQGGARKSSAEEPWIVDWTCSSNGNWAEAVLKGFAGISIDVNEGIKAKPIISDLELHGINFNGATYEDFINGSNLTAVIAFYVNIILGIDFSTYSENGGYEYFNNALKIVNNAQNAPESGWKAFESDRNRYWLAYDLMDSRYANYLTAMYSYHRLGMDKLSEEPEDARFEITESLESLKSIYRENPSAFLLKIFFDAKNEEIVNIYSESFPNEKARIVALKIEQEISRNKIDEYTKFVANFGAKGLAYIKVNDSTDLDNGLQSPILKFLSKEEISSLVERLELSSGDTVFFGADHRNVVNDSMGSLREKLGEDLNLIDKEAFKFGWITDFPLFEEDIQGNLSPSHHPFTASQGGITALRKNPANAVAKAYDLILNGSEIGGGSLRINNLDEQLEVLSILGIDKKEADEKFGFFLEALSYGCPPHGGIAFGLDRLIMLLCKQESIRAVSYTHLTLPTKRIV